ncbi:hypothetical protein FTX61_07010 [Nitriliruptoraceae bacterium ZYF776]|nr:hypothetical protein [Profundirhabdus halotolerans]
MTRRRQRRGGSFGSVPVVLPRVVIRPDAAGTVALTLDGAPVSEEPIPRVQLGEALSQIVDQVGTAVRVELHEPDGTIHADILTPPSVLPTLVDPPPAVEQPGTAERRPSPTALSDGGAWPTQPSPSRSPRPSRSRTPTGLATPDLDPYHVCNGRGTAARAGATSRTIQRRESV